MLKTVEGFFLGELYFEISYSYWTFLLAFWQKIPQAHVV